MTVNDHKAPALNQKQRSAQHRIKQAALGNEYHNFLIKRSDFELFKLLAQTSRNGELRSILKKSVLKPFAKLKTKNQKEDV